MILVFSITSVFTSIEALAAPVSLTFDGKIIEISNGISPSTVQIGDPVIVEINYETGDAVTQVIDTYNNGGRPYYVTHSFTSGLDVNSIRINSGSNTWGSEAIDRMQVTIFDDRLFGTTVTDEIIFTSDPGRNRVRCTAQNSSRETAQAFSEDMLSSINLPTSANDIDLDPTTIPFLCYVDVFDAQNFYTITILMEAGTLRDSTESKTVIFYVNGVATHPLDQQNHILVLRQLVRERFGGTLPDGLRIVPIYNPTETRWLDMAEAIRQNLLQANIAIGGLIIDLVFDWENQPSIIKDVARQTFNTLLQIEPSNQIAQTHLAEFRRVALDNGDRIIVIGHSQGNLFANAYYQLMTNDERDKTSVISVATPSFYTAGDGPHTTDLNDVISLVPGARWPNTTNTLDLLLLFSIDPFGHDFDDYYLRDGFESREKIGDDIVAAIQLPP